MDRSEGNSMPRKQTKPSTPVSPPTVSSSTDKKIHTASLGLILLILTNYQTEVKQILQLLFKWIT